MKINLYLMVLAVVGLLLKDRRRLKKVQVESKNKTCHRANRKLIFYPLCLLLAMFVLGCENNQVPEKKLFEVRVEQVISGQTIKIATDSETDSDYDRVRLIGIDAPDWRQKPWGLKAKTRLQNLIEGQSVWLEFDVKTQDDRYKRQFAYAWLDGSIFVNELLVQEGYVLAKERYPNTKYSLNLARAQEWARLRELGIWNPEQPMRLTPSEFRRENSQ